MPNERPDLEPGFWAEYTPPRSAVADAIQYPATQPELFINRLMTAYQKDCGILKRRNKNARNPL